jgi:hypothetical protein
MMYWVLSFSSVRNYIYVLPHFDCCGNSDSTYILEFIAQLNSLCTLESSYKYVTKEEMSTYLSILFVVGIDWWPERECYWFNNPVSVLHDTIIKCSSVLFGWFQSSYISPTVVWGQQVVMTDYVRESSSKFSCKQIWTGLCLKKNKF